MLTRPTFIFADENHYSPLLANLLAQLAPQFKQAGFDHFYYECSSDYSREQIIKLLQDQINLSEASKTLCPQIKQEILNYLPKPIPSSILVRNLDFLIRNDTNFDLLMLRFSKIMNENKDTPYEFYLGMTLGILRAVANEVGKSNMNRDLIESVLTKIVDEFKLPTAHAEANIRMLQLMADNHIEYKGVDDAVLRRNLTGDSTLTQFLDSFQAILDAPENIEKRNKTMITTYLQPHAPVIGFTGLAHVTGMQHLLTTMIPADIAQANYNFIYVYREPLDTANPALNRLRAEMRTGKAPLPMGVILIDGMNKTEEEISAEIMQRINEKIEGYAALPDHLKHIPDISFTGQVRAQLGNLFSMFSRAKDSIYQTSVDATEMVRSAINL